MANCMRCGREGHMEYGTDGQAYCSSCIFYGLNKQCGRCRMYLPASELQQYRGMWTCPYCIQDMRDEDKRATEYKAPEYKAPEYKTTKQPLEVISYPETCERCGKDAEFLYLWNGRMLCKSCLGEEQKKWGLMGGGPTGSAQAIPVRMVREAKKKSFIEAAVSNFLAVFGFKAKPRPPEELPRPKMSRDIEHARPMMEQKEKPEKASIEVEGPMEEKKEAARSQEKTKKSRAVPRKKKKQ